MSSTGSVVHHVDYRRLATHAGRVDGEIELSGMRRVRAETADAAQGQDVVVVDLGFVEDAQRRVRVEGSLDTTLQLTCQRCLREFAAPMHVDVVGIVVADDDAAANVPREHEPVQADGDLLDIHELVADELLLAMPNVARCDAPECAARYASNEAPERPTTDDKRTHPFAALGQLKGNDRNADD